MVVRRRAKVHPLEHPQGISGTEDQCAGRCKPEPEVRLHRSQDHHPLADKTGSARKAAVGHGEKKRKGGEFGHGIHHASVTGNFTRVHTVIQHADTQEHGARHKAVGDHLHQAAGDAEVAEHEEAERDKTHVRHRRIRHQLLHVLLHHGDQADVDHGDQRQADHQSGPSVRSVRSDGQRETQETIGPQLEHDRRQHRRSTGGCFDVHVGQPGVYRPHRHLDGECRQEGKEQQRLRGLTQGQLVPCKQVEAATGLGVEEDQRDQHQQGAEQCVQEELERGVNLVGAAPDADDQVHRDQGGFEEHVEQQAVERAKHADHQATEDQEGTHVLVHALRDDFPPGDDHYQVHEGCEQHEPQRDAIHPQVVVHVEAADPGSLLNELHRRRTQLEGVVQRQGHQEGCQCAHQCHPAHDASVFVAAKRQQDDAKSNWQPDSQAQQTHFSCSPSARRNTS